VASRDEYRARLRGTPAAEWTALLLAESGLPGPRANLELAQVAADEATPTQLVGWLADDAEYLALCGAFGLGRLVADGDARWLPRLRAVANDSRWRVREGVAMGLQRVGLRAPARLRKYLEPWCRGTWLEQRAVVAALCEPALVRDPDAARLILDILDRITTQLHDAERRTPADADRRVLRQALGYGWSVAIVGNPDYGKERFAYWAASDDPDIRWIVRENLKKARLKRLDSAWVNGFATC
jgi:hypothetical protein